MSDFTPKKLAENLVEKHDRFISEYSDEMEKAKQISMLREKKDQLRHWVEENGSKEKFRRELEETDKELTQLQNTYKPKSQSFYSGLKDKIEEHKKAREHWLGQIGESKS